MSIELPPGFLLFFLPLTRSVSQDPYSLEKGKAAPLKLASRRIALMRFMAAAFSFGPAIRGWLYVKRNIWKKAQTNGVAGISH